jgi:hypothetical protein
VKAFAQTFAANIITMLLLFVSYIFLKYADLPVHAVSADLTIDLGPYDLDALPGNQI